MLHANGRPGVMSVQGLVPPLAGGQSASQPDITLAYGAFLLAEQEQRYGNGEEPPVPVQQLPYDGPPVRFLMSGRQVKFCSSREDVMYHYSMVPQGIGPSYHPVAEYAACLQGPFGSGIVRTRVNITGHAPTAITASVADKLGLQQRPLRGGGAVSSIIYNGSPTPLDVLTEPLTVQLLSGPGTVAFEVTLPAVVVLTTPNPGKSLFELQLGLFDFCQLVDIDWIPLWASQFTHLESGYQFALPVIAPPPPHAHMRGSSTFHITQDSYEEVAELSMIRQRVMARRAAAAAAAAGSNDGPSPAEAAAEAEQQATRIEAATAPAAPPAAPEPAPAAAVGTQEWIDEWAPATQQRQQPARQRQRGRGGRRGGRRNVGRGSHQQQGRGDASGGGGDFFLAGSDADALQAQVAAGAAGGIYEKLEPLPAGPTACCWHEVAASSLPEGDDVCTICMDAFTDPLEGGGERFVTQLHCRHTYCVLCLREFSTNRTFKRRPLQCPQCRTDV